MRRLLNTSATAATALVITIGLAACGGDDGDGASSNSPDTDDAAQDGTDDGLSGEVQVWVMGDSGTTLSEAVADFTAETGVDVTVDAVPWDSVNDRLTTAVASGEGPDVVQVGLSLLPTFEEADVLLDLSEYVIEYPGIDPENFPDAVAPERLSADGAMTSVPWVSDTRVLFYRSDLLAEVGYDAPPATWEEMHEVAGALAERDGGEYGYYIPLWDAPLPVAYTWQAGGDVVNGTGEVDLPNPAFEEAMDHYLRFFVDGVVPTATDFDQTVGFVSGSTPMVVSGPYLADAIRDQAPDLDGSWSVAPVPAGPQSATSLYAGSNLGVWKTSQNPEAAVALIEYLTSPEVQLAWFDETNELPTSLEALDQLAASGDEEGSVYVEQLQDARTLPMVPEWDPIGDELLAAVSNIVVGDTEPNDALAEFYTNADEIATRH